LRGSCPTPDIENELSYESRESVGPLSPGDEGAFLVTKSADAAQFDSQYFKEGDEQWVKATDFDEAVVLGVQVGSSGESSPLRVLGVGRDSPDTIRAYTCIEQQGHTDDWAPYTKLLRVNYNRRAPHTATLIHWEEGEKQTFE